MGTYMATSLSIYRYWEDDCGPSIDDWVIRYDILFLKIISCQKIYIIWDPWSMYSIIKIMHCLCYLNYPFLIIGCISNAYTRMSKSYNFFNGK